MIGTNNILKSGAESAVAGVQAVLDLLAERRPHTPVLLHAVLPLRPRMETGYRCRKAGDVQHVNDVLAQMAAARPLTRFVDCRKAVAGTHGELLPVLMPDGMHPNLRGHQALADCYLPEL